MESEDHAAIRGFWCWRAAHLALWYARKMGATPPVLMRAETLPALRVKIDQWHVDHPAGQPYRYTRGSEY